MISSLITLEMLCMKLKSFLFSECKWDHYNGQPAMDEWLCVCHERLTLDSNCTNLKCMEVGANVDNINVIFLKYRVTHRKLSNEELDSRWMCLGYDKNFMLKGHCFNVTSKLKSKFVPLWSMCTTWYNVLIWQLLCCRLNPCYKISTCFFVHYLKKKFRVYWTC